MDPRCRPLSQQFAPEEQVLPMTSIVRDEWGRKSIRHEPLPEKELPQYPTLTKQPHQQFAPDETVLPGQTIPVEPLELQNQRHQPLSQKPVEAREDTPKSQVPLSSGPNGLTMGTEPKNQEKDSPEIEKNGELPYDQLIPLEELPRDQQFGRYLPQPPVTVVDNQPLLRRPQRRRTTQPKNDNYNSRASMCIGIILIIIGICEIILNILGIVFQQMYRTNTSWNIVFYLAPGFWCSIFFILCGTFGIVSARRKVTWAIVTHLVSATLASVFGFLLLAMCAWGIYRELTLPLNEPVTIQLHCLCVICLMGFGAVLAIPLAIAASIICCNVFCRK